MHYTSGMFFVAYGSIYAQQMMIHDCYMIVHFQEFIRMHSISYGSIYAQ